MGGAEEGARAALAPPTPLRAQAPAGPRLPALAPPLTLCARRRASLRTMARLLALLGPAAKVGARVRPRATWFLGAAAPCAPPPLFLPLLRPGPEARLLGATRGGCGGRQVSLPTPTPDPIPVPLRPKERFAGTASRDLAPQGPQPPYLYKPRKRSLQLTARETESQGSIVICPRSQSPAGGPPNSQSVGGSRASFRWDLDLVLRPSLGHQSCSLLKSLKPRP